MTTALRIGVLGAANIARLFIAAVRPSKKVVVQAVAARDNARARAFADELQVPHVHASYDALLADPDIDAVYVPLPNNLHAEWSIRAANAGKHVLCEKPLAATAQEARSIFEAARRNKVYVVEGYPYRAQPQTIKLRELLAAGTIGRLQFVHAAFGFPLTDAANIRMDPALAGGALMDAGSYPVSLVRTVAAERPRARACHGALGRQRRRSRAGRFARVRKRPPGADLVQLHDGTPSHARFIVGDAGSIETAYYNDTSTQLPPHLHVKRGTGWDAKQETIETAATGGFFAEAEAFHDLVAHGWSRWVGVTPEESIDIALTLEALATSAREGRTVDVGG